MKTGLVKLDAVLQLGPARAAELALYRFGLASGHYRRLTPPRGKPRSQEDAPLQPILPPAPPRELLANVMGSGAEEILREADEITRGLARLFGGPAVPLNLVPQPPLQHWTAYERGRAPWGVEDVKFIWEGARFGWAVSLARAYQLSGNDSYAQCFQRLAGQFFNANPVNLGPNWASGQEVAIRLIALAFAACVFGSQSLVNAATIAQHARRIPPTLIYARAQNNNHLLSEAVGLYTAATLLPQHPEARAWCKTGWQWMNHCFQHQIAADGTYIQHSLNYHRLMLQLALWARCVAHSQGQSLPPQSQERLGAATLWLLERLDARSGRVPNLGHNDGAYILPLAGGGFADYRPTAQAASRAFLGQPFLPAGPWDEMSLWLGDLNPDERRAHTITLEPLTHQIVKNGAGWASLRAAQYTSRPGQADLLHVDIWQRGAAVTLDAGTFQYNAAPPWENALAGSTVHNTVTIEHQDQMRRAGRFLWLDWPRVFILKFDADSQTVGAFHEGYVKRWGVIHRRELSLENDSTWLVADKLFPTGKARQVAITLHWLLPDGLWQLEGQTLKLETETNLIKLSVTTEPESPAPEIQLIRAGQALVGTSPESPIFGWYSPTYSLKLPALALRLTWRCTPPLVIYTRIHTEALKDRGAV